MSRVANALLALRTLPSLRWEQIVYRGVRRVQQAVSRAPRPRVVPTWRGDLHLPWLLAVGPGDADARMAAADRLLVGEFRFLNHTTSLPVVDWRARHVSHLWTYHLHYGEWALDLAWAARLTESSSYAERAVQLMMSWVEGTDAGRGDGWSPFPIAVRLDRWVRALALLGEHISPAQRERLLASVAMQAAHLARRLEFHVLGNHLLVNYCGLAMVGLWCDGADAESWRTVGLRGMQRELSEQVLRDGGHFERSPTYHALVLADVLRVLAAAAARSEHLPPDVAIRAGAMLQALDVLYRPDDTPQLFNDATLDMAPSPREVRRLAECANVAVSPRRLGVVSLPETGYYACTRDDGSRLVLDCGDIGPAYQPGHGHNDLLSFEFDDRGVPVIVDTGLHGYDGDPFREFARSTRAHNTVTIDDREQSELWATFRVARRAVVGRARVSGTANDFVFEGTYQPYHNRHCAHRRTVRWSGGLEVRDDIRGAPGARLRSHLHIHPDWDVALDGTRAVLRRGDREIVVDTFGVDLVTVQRGARDPMQGWYLPTFGTALPSACLLMQVHSNDGCPFGFRLLRADMRLLTI